MPYKPKTNLELRINFLIIFIKSFTNYKLTYLSFQLLSILFGFFVSTALSTIPAQTGDWGIIAAAVITTNQEIISKIIYQKDIKFFYHHYVPLKKFLKYCNSIKIGILYGLFVDAFKLGS